MYSFRIFVYSCMILQCIFDPSAAIFMYSFLFMCKDFAFFVTSYLLFKKDVIKYTIYHCILCCVGGTCSRP